MTDNQTTEDHNAKWEREARDLASSLLEPVTDAIRLGLAELSEVDVSCLAERVIKVVLTGLISRFRQEAVISGGVDEWAYRTSMNYLNLLEVMAGVPMTDNV